jgi:H+/Cl- antiporter ClcA
MSAVFSTPIAATLLAVELLLFEWRPRSFIPVATASVVAWLLRVPLMGAGPIFPVAPHDSLGWQAIVIAVAIGIATGFGSALLTALVYRCEDAFYVVLSLPRNLRVAVNILPANIVLISLN